MELASEKVEEARCGKLNRGIAATVTKQRVRVSARQGVEMKARVCVWVEGRDMRYDIDSCYGTSMETLHRHLDGRLFYSLHRRIAKEWRLSTER